MHYFNFFKNTILYLFRLNKNKIKKSMKHRRLFSNFCYLA
nr:MAG TPA: E2-like protein [Caudoviricetes sp.]